MWTPRRTTPGVDIKYYRGTGYYYGLEDGVNDCIVIDTVTGYVMPNCVGYTWGRWYEAFGTRPYLSTGPAVGWYAYTVDGYARSTTTPQVGAICCFAGGLYGGHVSVIEEIHYDGGGNILFLETSNSAYNDTLFWMEPVSYDNALQTWTRPVSGYTFQGFILPPEDTVKKLTLFGAAQRRLPNGMGRILGCRRY